ncbi:MAG: PfkB family carbohydrate kinase [Desulfosarcinaceae bacterium]|nr:PfkB family carbohydrate kinase [Desulfosarcinaceae bacterium]
MEVLVIGRNCVDHIAVTERLPRENTKAPMLAHHMEGGGQGGTSACAIARLGGLATLVGKVGGDAGGEFCRRRLEDFGVACEHLETVSGKPTAQAHIWVTRTNGNRTILYTPSELPPIAGDATLRQMCRRAAVVLLDPEVTYLAAFLAGIARPRGLLVYDAERWRPGIRQMMAAADYFVPSADFFDAPELGLQRGSWIHRLEALRKRVGGHLVVTRGEAGAFYFDGDRLWQVAAPTVAVADTIGAGDVFHGALALALARSTPVDEAVKLAVAAASLSCRGYGGRAGLADRAETEALAARLTASPV